MLLSMTRLPPAGQFLFANPKVAFPRDCHSLMLPNFGQNSMFSKAARSGVRPLPDFGNTPVSPR
jgi:hypothetical protein